MEGGAILRAVYVHEKGGPEKLTVGEGPDPEAGPGEILVEVAAAGLNYIDTYHRSGLYPTEYPMIPGVEGAGRVIDVGPGVEEYRVGDRVAWPWGVVGSYAEKLALPTRWAVPIPEDQTEDSAVALMVQGMTAHYLATDTFPLRPGARCLIHAGAGGVGLLLTQVAKIRGAEVITTVGTDEKAEMSRRAGADHVVVYTRDDFGAAVEEIHGPAALDVVYDGVGAATFERGLDLLRPRGMMVTYGNASGPPAPFSPLVLSRKGSLYLTRPTLADYIQTREEMMGRAADLFRWSAEGRVTVHIGAEFSLEEAAQAHRALEGRLTTGKILIRP